MHYSKPRWMSTFHISRLNPMQNPCLHTMELHEIPVNKIKFTVSTNCGTCKPAHILHVTLRTTENKVHTEKCFLVTISKIRTMMLCQLNPLYSDTVRTHNLNILYTLFQHIKWRKETLILLHSMSKTSMGKVSPINYFKIILPGLNSENHFLEFLSNISSA